TADWLHRELVSMLDGWAFHERGVMFAELPADAAAGLKARLVAEYRHNTYDPATGAITVSPARAAAIEAQVAYYTELFRDGKVDYALPRGSITEPARARALSAFVF